MRNLHALAAFAALSGGFYAAMRNYSAPRLGALILTPHQVALGHAYEGNRRKRGKHPRPTLKTNRNHISKRVRRKHRRAA
jgi:hypothetical protein